jgi:hypothetical protein
MDVFSEKVSSFPSAQRSYTSDQRPVQLVPREFSSAFGVRELEFVSRERKEGNQEVAGYQDCSDYDGCRVAVIKSVVSWKTERVQRDSVVL